MKSKNGRKRAITIYYHNNPSGSPIVATDESGKLNTSTHSEDNPIGFHGKSFDDHTGLIYMGARYYHPVLGRFTGVDPVGFKPENIHSHNRYTYANNNPYRYVDPDGMWAEEVFPEDAPILTIGSSYVALAAYIVGVTTDDPALDQEGMYVLQENREKNIEVLMLLGTLGRGKNVQSGSGNNIVKGTLPESIFIKKAPEQVAPGIRTLKGQHANDRGRIEPWEAHYDSYGRLIGRTDYNAGNKANGIPDTHHHKFEYGVGKKGENTTKSPPWRI